jgi:hypothetical protein
VKPVYQTILSAPGGNCWHACIASILELPIDQIPDYQQAPGESDADWYERWQRWLEPMNLVLLSWVLKPGGWAPKGYAILGSQPPGCSWQHATVCLDGKPVWNPMPGYGERIGNIGEWQDWTTFGVLDPSKPIALPQEVGRA